ncbi:MAG: hypothetical protein N2484_03005 [Clostridia bacterium]|nr:hypothetical protein [Clostridia bacterium]
MSKSSIGFSIAGSILCILFFITVNLTVNSMAGVDTLWFIYPVFAVLWWPISLFFYARCDRKGYSIISSALIIIFLITVNIFTSPDHPWFLYAVYPVLWWPITLISGERAKTLSFAWCGCISTILYYSALNALISPGYPWAIYPAYAVLWWPISLYFARRKQFFSYSMIGSTITILFFICVNYISSPRSVWAVYPIFGVLWWPLSMYYFSYKKQKSGQGQLRRRIIF